jgi:hypothetical protein
LSKRQKSPNFVDVPNTDDRKAYVPANKEDIDDTAKTLMTDTWSFIFASRRDIEKI